MRHRIYGRKLCRDSEHRIAMRRNLAAALFEHGEIETTLPKAKSVQPFVEKIITIAKQGTFHARRQIEQKINDRHIHAWVADSNVPESKKDNPYFDLPDPSSIEFNRYGDLRKAPRLVQHIMTVIGPMFDDRDGGYTRIIKLGRHRLGDAADLVLLQLVGQEDGPQIGGGYSRRREQMNKRAAFAAKLRKDEPGEEAETATAVAEVDELTNEDAADAILEGEVILDAEDAETEAQATSENEDESKPE